VDFSKVFTFDIEIFKIIWKWTCTPKSAWNLSFRSWKD